MLKNKVHNSSCIVLNKYFKAKNNYVQYLQNSTNDAAQSRCCREELIYFNRNDVL